MFHEIIVHNDLTETSNFFRSFIWYQVIEQLTSWTWQIDNRIDTCVIHQSNGSQYHIKRLRHSICDKWLRTKYEPHGISLMCSGGIEIWLVVQRAQTGIAYWLLNMWFLKTTHCNCINMKRIERKEFPFPRNHLLIYYYTFICIVVVVVNMSIG